MCRGGLIAKRLNSLSALECAAGRLRGKTKRPLHIGNRQCVQTAFWATSAAIIQSSATCGRFRLRFRLWQGRLANPILQPAGPESVQALPAARDQAPRPPEGVQDPSWPSRTRALPRKSSLGGSCEVQLRCPLGKRQGAGVGRRTAIFRKRLLCLMQQAISLGLPRNATQHAKVLGKRDGEADTRRSRDMRRLNSSSSAKSLRARPLRHNSASQCCALPDFFPGVSRKGCSVAIRTPRPKLSRNRPQ